MNEPLHDYMRTGILHFMIYPDVAVGEGPILETLASLAYDPFFDVVEVTRIMDKAKRKEAHALAEQAGIELHFGAQPILLGGKLDLNHSEPGEREKAVEAVHRGIDQAEELGCKTVAVLSGKVNSDKDAAIGWLVESLMAICEYAESKGIGVTLETFDQVPYGKNCLIGPTSDAVRVSKAVRERFPHFGLILDSSHLPLQGEPFTEAIREAGDHLVHAHMGNCIMDDPEHPAYGDNHPRIGMPGGRNGVAELADYLRALLDTGYLSKERRPVLSFEVKPMPGERTDAVVAGSKRALLEAWRRV